MSQKKIVLAYSGGLDTSIILRWLQENYNAEVICYTADIGQDIDKKKIISNAQKFGVKIVDVRIKRADLPQANSEAIYRRMQTEREREAKEFRARGAEMAVTITSTADKEVSVILANANKDSEIMKGEGDGERNKIFAEAFGRDPEFFAFYRAMQAYETALIGGDTSLILSPDSEFFKFFGNIKPKSQ